MKTVFLLFDTLNRRALEPYGGTSVKTPNFSRLAERSVTFEKHYAGSLPCMPARRDLQTGRLNFLHRSWGPLEPFDNSFPELLGRAGVYTHLVSDHYHYWEDGGATYHNRYATYEFIRGQEGDAWKAMVEPPWERLREKYHKVQRGEGLRDYRRKNIVNREFIRDEDEFPSVRCFAAGFDFLDRNREADNWFLQIECFDPHEPFTAPARFRKDYPTNYSGPILDWPPYARVTELPEECAELRANYAAILAMCDELLGRLLDYFDAHDLWRSTALIVGTDHGFLLGEHDWWAKNRMPCYEEVAHIPLFVHHPEFRSAAGARRRSLTATMDLMPTILELHGVDMPQNVLGRSLLPALAGEAKLHEGVLYGVWGSATNLADGRYTYFRFPEAISGQEIYNYTLMPAHIATFFHPSELGKARLSEPFSFTKGVPLLKIPGTEKSSLPKGLYVDHETVLFDIERDPEQLRPLDDPETEARLAALMARLMNEADAPPEAFSRLGLPVPEEARVRGRLVAQGAA
ncbi:MAG: sulfatase-like hydrolase/transferase [Alphaproteobacteria bacterium]|nr:sulfatase-like hydrolase/transferase [Alphaproteobacteria bacterium]